MSEVIDCDVLVVGSGPGGAATAATLSAAGRDVLVVEEGPDGAGIDTRPYSSEEMDAKYRNAGLTPCLGRGRVTYAEGRCLGGGSEVNSGFFHRLPADVLDGWVRDHALDGLSEEALAPLYDEIETRLHVGPVGVAEGPASQVLRRGADALGWRSQEVPRWIRTQPTEDGGWDAVQYGMNATYLADARANGCRIETGVRIERLVFEGRRAVSAIGHRLRGYRPAERVSIRFRDVFVSAGAIGSALLLRRSGVRRNVGNTLKLHPMVRVIGEFPEEVNEGGFGVPVRQVMEFKPSLTLGCSVSALPHLALWMAGPNRDEVLSRSAHMAIFYALVTSESCGSVRALRGIADPLVRYNLAAADYDRLADGLGKLCRLLFEAGAVRIHLPMSGTGPIETLDALAAPLERFERSRPEVTAIHLFGSVPMGGDPARHPVDPHGRLRDRENVWVNDVSILPGCTGVNPQATVLAFALRNARGFAAR